MIAKLIQFSLKNKLLIVLCFVGVSTAGALSLTKLPIDAFPDISPNLVQVFAELEGMAAEEIEQYVTRPVEVAMRAIPGAKKIRSISSLGLSTINIYFEDNVDIYLARQLVSERLKEAEEGIPETMNMPHGLEMSAIASGMGKILSYYIKGDVIDRRIDLVFRNTTIQSQVFIVQERTNLCDIISGIGRRIYTAPLIVAKLQKSLHEIRSSGGHLGNGGGFRRSHERRLLHGGYGQYPKG